MNLARKVRKPIVQRRYSHFLHRLVTPPLKQAQLRADNPLKTIPPRPIISKTTTFTHQPFYQLSPLRRHSSERPFEHNRHVSLSPSAQKLLPNQLYIKVHHSTLNPIDVWMKNGYGKSIFEPLRDYKNISSVLGRECVGTVEAIGDSVWDFKPGDLIISVSDPLAPSGFHSPYAYANQYQTSLLPSQGPHSARSMAAFGYAALTALSAVRAHFDPLANLKEGAPQFHADRALVIGASGAVGSCATLLLNRSGWSVDGVASGSVTGKQRMDLLPLKNHFSSQEFSESEPTLDQRYQLIVDCGPPSSNTMKYLDLLTNEGRYVSVNGDFVRQIDSRGVLVGGVSGLVQLSSEKIIARSGYNVNLNWAIIRPDGSDLSMLCQLAQQEEWPLFLDKKQFTLAQLDQAFLHFESGEANGKIIIDCN